MQFEAVPDSLVYAEQGFPQPVGVYYGGQNKNDVMGFGDGVGTNNAMNIYVARYRSSDVNALYYDPDVRYDPWISSNGNPMAAANPLAALFNPIAPSNGSLVGTIDLTSSAQGVVWGARSWAKDTNPGSNVSEKRDFYPATHFRYIGGTGCTGAKTSTLTSCFSRIEIKPANAPFIKTTDRTDCAGTSCTYQEEIQNFANWFQYWRSRILMARGGTGIAFAKQATNLRVGFGAINAPTTSINGVNTAVIQRGVSTDFSGTNRTGFFDLLYQHPMPSSGTPLRQAMDVVGKYFQRTDIGGPWQNVINSGVNSDQATCRQNYHILMTDGFWNGSSASSPANQNNDGTSGSLMTSSSGSTYQYSPVNPYQDSNSDTLADVAMYYWKTDLRPDWGVSKKNVPVASTNVDPAFWQHLVTYTVGLGVVGTLDPATDLPALTAGTKSWTTPSADSINNVDDLWHAAINGHGQYFSAANPKQFGNSLASALNDIAARSGDAAAVGTSSNTVRAGSKLYVSTYNTKDWSGGLQQLNIDSAGTITGTDWTIDQNTVWPQPRNIFSYRDSIVKGVAFDFANLATTDQTYFTSAATLTFGAKVTGSDIVDYIKGNKTKEVLSGGPFRDRQNLLGDLVGSTPQFISEGEDEGYSFLPAGTPGQSSYFTFYTSTKKSRLANPKVYVGSNDGMLHAFRVSDGRETFAYVPKTVMSNLPSLADPAYTHKFFVNGTPTIADAYIGGWKTVLVGTTGAGGRGVFALDVTTGGTFQSTDVLWEVNSSDDPEIGYTIGNPQVGRAANGDWVAVFGNGYESNSKRAILFMVNLSTGVITKVDTGVGSNSLPNGLATPRLVIDENSTIVAAYAGDLQGNLWKFDFGTSGTTVAFSGTRLFQAVSSGKAQPITVQPDLYPHPLGGLIVTFGTGKLFETADPSITDTQSIYGIWDNSGIANVTASTVAGQSNLVQQTLSSVGTGLTLLSNNSVDWNSKRGWYINLAPSERIIIDPEVVYRTVFYTTVIPGSATDPCITDGTSVTMVIDPITGGAVNRTVLDTNKDNKVDATDIKASGISGSLTFGNTILRKKGGVKMYKADTGGKIIGGSKAEDAAPDSIPTLRLWRQILGKD
ncbi:pilus assembly protein [Undibacterium sp. Rencai35W]|uniref:pilus assembly protein n=1 Tax=Undibacterium sp. Rencai35W TaxID=3413046 RepID=UPI003BF28BE2